MLNITRQQKIYNLIKDRGSASVSELQELFGVSEMTIRRDLKTLDGEGIITRVHGGAAVSHLPGETLFSDRVVVNKELKCAIAETAVSKIEQNDSIFIDGSTTCSELADILPEDMNITVCTNSLEAIIKLRRKNGISILSLGGDLAGDGNTFDGLMTSEAAEKIVVDKCFISGASFTEKGAFNAGMVGTAVKKIMLGNSRKGYLLADSTKYKGRGMIELCKWPDIDVFICDNLLPETFKPNFMSLGIEIIFAQVK